MDDNRVQDRPAVTVDEVCTIVATAIARRHGRDEHVDPDTEVLLTGMLDSLTLAAIVVDLEARIGTKFPERFVVARNFRTPTALHEAVEAALGQVQR